jgi:hypothetical protein
MGCVIFAMRLSILSSRGIPEDYLNSERFNPNRHRTFSPTFIFRPRIMKPFYCWNTGRSLQNPLQLSKFFAAFLVLGPGCMPSSSFPGHFAIWCTVLSPGIAISGWANPTRAAYLLHTNGPDLFSGDLMAFRRHQFLPTAPSSPSPPSNNIKWGKQFLKVKTLLNTRGTIFGRTRKNLQIWSQVNGPCMMGMATQDGNLRIRSFP